MTYVALNAFTGEEEGDLSVQVTKGKSAYFYRKICICTSAIFVSLERGGFENSFEE